MKNKDIISIITDKKIAYFQEKAGEVQASYESHFQSIIKQMLIFGLTTEVVFVISESFFNLKLSSFLGELNIQTTAKMTSYNTFETESIIKSYGYMGITIHFKIIKN